MKLVSSILAFSIVIFGNVSAKTYYVSSSGVNTNSGLTPSLAWKTLTYAAGSSSPVVAGDVVYVHAGNYGAEKVVFQKSGVVGNPISFIGYQTTPGDAPPLLVNNTNAYAGFLSTDMPTFDGGNRASGTAFNCLNQKYLVIKNFQIQNYVYGVMTGSTSQQDVGNLVFYNVNAMSLGDVSSDYSGYGFLFGSMGTKFSNNNTLENCMVVNAAAEGFGINGDNNTLKGCKVYCNENTSNAATDYYIYLTGNYNTVVSCYVERLPGLSHAGHGISIKSNAEQVVDHGLPYPVINPQYNKVLYCIAKNMGESFCVRHRGVQNNFFYHCKAVGTHTGAVNSPRGEGNCIVTRDGASNNTFDGCIAENCAAGFVFEDTVEDGDTGTNPPGHPGNNNRYINCLISNCYIGVFFDAYAVPSDAGDNTIANCTFYKTRYIYEAARHCANMKYIGNIYYGCLPIVSGGYFKGNTYSSDIVPNGTNSYFKNCDFVNIQGGLPANFASSSAGSITSDPLLNNPAASDFHLKPTSPCIDASIPLSYVKTDYDSTLRQQGARYDIGAYEYKTGGTSFSTTVSSTNVSCNGGNNGNAVVAASGGKSPYTYVWSNGKTTSAISGLNAGNYTVTVSDATPSAKVLTVTITEPLANINTVTSKSNVSYPGGNDGMLTILSEGGTPGYTYLWMPSNQTTATATGLSARDYIVRVTDANACVATRTLTITEPASTTISGSIVSANVSCNGGNNGNAVVAASGGKSPYTYVWSNGKTTSEISGLNAGNYTVTVSDATPSAKAFTVTITEPLANINTVTSKSNVSYPGGDDGMLTILSEGGTPGYTYLWMPSNQTTATATGLSARDYILRVTDANACVATRTLTITEPASTTISGSIVSANVSCNGGNNGNAVVAASGGKSPYTYVWSNGKTTSAISGLNAGNYTVTVSDATPSAKVFTVTITEPLVNINTVTSKSNVSHYGGNDGKLIISSEGGTPGYTYLWTPSNQTTATATGLSARDYILRVTDANACVATRTLTITQPIAGSTPDISSVLDQTAMDKIRSENAFAVFPNPATGPFTVLISNPEKGNNVLVAVRDLLGKEFYSKVFVLSDNTQITMDHPGYLAPGVYMVIVTTSNNVFQKKIVIQ